MRWGDGFVLVYDITDRGSFEEVGPLRSLLEEVKKPKNVPLVLVGNKSDLDHVRQVGTEEGERLAAEMACAFYECSACADEGGAVAEAFHELCREVRRRKAVQGKARPVLPPDDRNKNCFSPIHLYLLKLSELAIYSFNRLYIVWRSLPLWYVAKMAVTEYKVFHG
uniref:small monomeric GTPase n=1 Tax=Neolamprologus brichardi TaxID=32507 RepID=A0A3Q4HYS1_NEOBR